MLKALFIFVLGAVCAVVALASRRPDTFHFSRSVTINAPADKIFERINTQAKWKDWSPWAKLDPAMKSSLSGPESGVGSAYSWDGNNKVGAGSSTITESVPSSKVVMRLDFLRPFAGTNTATFTLAPEAGGTRVTWAMDGTSNLMMKTMGLVMNCEKMMDAQFDEGLANLKRLVEAE